MSRPEIRAASPAILDSLRPHQTPGNFLPAQTLGCPPSLHPCSLWIRALGPPTRSLLPIVASPALISMATLTTPTEQGHCAQLTQGLSPATGHPFGVGRRPHTCSGQDSELMRVSTLPPQARVTVCVWVCMPAGAGGCAQVYECVCIGTGVENTTAHSTPVCGVLGGHWPCLIVCHGSSGGRCLPVCWHLVGCACLSVCLCLIRGQGRADTSLCV